MLGEISVSGLVVQPKASRWLRDEILDHREVVPVHAVEHVVAVEADVIYQSLPRESHADAEIHYRVSGSWGIALAESCLFRRSTRLDHSHIDGVLIGETQQAPKRRREGKRHVLSGVPSVHIISARLESKVLNRLDGNACVEPKQTRIRRAEFAHRE